MHRPRHRAWLLACLGLAACEPSAPSRDGSGRDEPAAATPTKANAAATTPTKATPIDASTAGKRCNAAGFSALATSMTDDQPELAARGLVERCDAELPPRLRWVIRTMLPEHEAELMRTPKADPAETAIWDAACVDHLEVLKSAAQATSQDRTAVVYVGCKLDRYALLTEAELATREPSGLPLWVAHQWMLDHGASPADARRISLGLFEQWDLAARRLAAGP